MCNGLLLQRDIARVIYERMTTTTHDAHCSRSGDGAQSIEFDALSREEWWPGHAVAVVDLGSHGRKGDHMEWH